MTNSVLAQRVQGYRTREHSNVLAGDVGGTNLRLAVLNAGQILTSVKVAMSGFQCTGALVGAICSSLDDLVVRHDFDKGAIGFPCPVSNEGEPLYQPPNLGFSLNGIMAQINQRTGKKLFAVNDARAAVWGEAMFGAGKNYDVVVWNGIGTGYGYAVVDGEMDVLPSAMEGGHVQIVNPLFHDDAKECGCGAKGCVEAYVSGPNLAQMYAGDKGLPKDQVTGKIVGDKFLEGDGTAKIIMGIAMKHLAQALVSSHVQTFAGVQVMGGGVFSGEVGEKLLPILQGYLRTPGIVPWGHNLADRVVLSELRDDAGLLGAGVLAEL